MDFLHHSRIGSHGRLKSSNCIVDARWVIRLSSFGLHQFRDNETPNTEGIQEGRELLWTSPELLRAQMNLALASVIWIQKSDIYSYAILLYEIFGRAGPWGDEVTDPKDIAERVKNPKDPRKPFRPDMKTIADAPKIIKETVAASWAEAPEQRPNFAQIRRKLRPITKGIKKTVVENMVKMMEKYTSKLEGVIELRSHELDLERKKSEKLLKMMLPESVADSLRVGINVDAE
uniref:guanylate cyclase n=1 Tax=Plectus sambesii TaxID=2011161 RepID=A0A914X2I2_9BILA